MIEAAPGWPAVTEIDPEPFRRWETVRSRGEDGKVEVDQYLDESLFYYLGPLGEAVEGRDPDAVATVLWESNGWCTADLVPDLPQADVDVPRRGR